MKKLINKIKNIKFIINYGYILILAIPFIFMPIFNSLLIYDINYSNKLFYSPILFNISWIVLFIGLSISFKDKIGKIIYIIFSSLSLLVFLVNNVYYSMTKTMFDYILLQSTSEGSSYFLDALTNCNPFVYICFIILLINVIIGIKFCPKKRNFNYKFLVGTLLIFLVLHTITPYTLGKANKSLTWSSWRNQRNIYNNFNDGNKCIKIAGFYEYNIRNFYINYLKSEEEINKEEQLFLEDSFKEEYHKSNNYTGLFKDKNLIILQLEGLDNWTISKEDTPNIYKLMNEGINFNKHYSYYNGGGSTFNSEFAINTGFITPLSYTRNAYSFNKNNFDYSLANIFKESGYSVNAFHMNTGEFYSRTINYKNWGYDNYYGLIDMFNYENNNYELDSELILNKEFSDLMISNKFVDYIITYSPHLPFSSSKGVCSMLTDKTNLTEEECVRIQVSETDKFVGLLLNKLKENKVLDNTVIVGITDHYLYTLEDQSILDKYKNTSNNLINNTPFFIWSSNIEHKNIKKVTSQLNVLPTILNLFGYKYNINNYIGEDALNPKYEGIVFFSDYSWYDGTYYVENGLVTNKKKYDNNIVNSKNEYISYLTKKNDLALKYNYFYK